MNRDKLHRWMVSACTLLCSLLWLGSPAQAGSGPKPQGEITYTPRVLSDGIVP